MEKERVHEIVSGIDPALVEEADGAGRGNKKRLSRLARVGLIAACLCAVLLGTAAAAKLSGIRITGWIHHQPHEYPDGTTRFLSGYSYADGVTLFPADELPSQVIDAIRDQYTYLGFSSWEEAEEFLGTDLMNDPALELAHHREYLYYGLEDDNKASGFCILTLCSAEPGLVWIDANASYFYYKSDETDFDTDNAVKIKINAQLYTDKYTEWGLDPAIHGNIQLYPDGSEFIQQSYTTPNGLETQVIQVNWSERTAPKSWYTNDPFDFGIEDVPVEPTTYHAIFSLNGIIFSIEASHDTDSDFARAVLMQVLDGFEVQ